MTKAKVFSIAILLCIGTIMTSCGGTNGIDGSDGTNGIDGSDGANGIDGSDGANGAAGLDGADGADGADGTNGADGADWPGPLPAAYVAADGIAGGAAYSKWWTSEAAGDDIVPSTTASADFYRCKACHGWDGLGNAGSYADRTGQSTGKATRPDVSSVNLRSTIASETPQELYDLVAHVGSRDIDAADNMHPDMSMDLDPGQIWNIVKFMREEWINPNELYDLAVTGPEMYWDYSTSPTVLVKPTLTYTNIGAKGDAINGDILYASKCAGCHGANGTTSNIPAGFTSLGDFMRSKPHEAWFKMKFGGPGSMSAPGLITATSDMQDIYAAVTNTTNYPD